MAARVPARAARPRGCGRRPRRRRRRAGSDRPGGRRRTSRSARRWMPETSSVPGKRSQKSCHWRSTASTQIVSSSGAATLNDACGLRPGCPPMWSGWPCVRSSQAISRGSTPIRGKRVGEDRVVGRRHAAIDQRRDLPADQVRPQRGVGDRRVVRRDAEDPVGDLGRLSELHRRIHPIIPMKGYHGAVTPHHWLGIDIGTSSAKALLVDDRGAVVGPRERRLRDGVRAPAAASSSAPRTTSRARARAIAACGAAGRPIAGIGVVGQTPTLVLVDEDGRAVRPAMTWQDTRAGDEAAELAAELGPSEPLFGTELPWAPAYPPAKLLWLARHEPRRSPRRAGPLQPKDYVGLHLTGSPVSDPWSSKGITHVLDGAPAQRGLERVGWPAGIAPDGRRRLVAARPRRPRPRPRAFGLPAGTPVAVGWSDALAGMLAAGAFAEETRVRAHGHLEHRRRHDALRRRGRRRAARDPHRVRAAARRLRPDAVGRRVARVARPGAARRHRGGAGARGRAARRRPRAAHVRALPRRRARADLALGRRRGALRALGHARRGRARARGRRGRLPQRAPRAGDRRGGRRAAVPSASASAGRGVSAAPWRDARRAAFARPLLLLDEADASALGAAMLGAAAAAGGDLAGADRLRSGAGAPRRQRSGGFARYRAASRRRSPGRTRSSGPSACTSGVRPNAHDRSGAHRRAGTGRPATARRSRAARRRAKRSPASSVARESRCAARRARGSRRCRRRASSSGSSPIELLQLRVVEVDAARDGHVADADQPGARPAPRARAGGRPRRRRRGRRAGRRRARPSFSASAASDERVRRRRRRTGGRCSPRNGIVYGTPSTAALMACVIAAVMPRSRFGP